ncbi:MAG: uroporphyrinogen-III C-methyltransferase [Zoogloeaceae bacterium]|jgi:uroporphyrin-3 C-methyltransferase|nr:uroporphyrinogen-III C-methyltransferase [Zoogloeaceae bacterium]
MNAKVQLPVLHTSARRFFWHSPWFWVAFIVLAFSLWQWLETRAALSGARQEMAQRLVESERQMQESRALANKAMSDAAELQRKYGALEARLSEFQDQANALQSLYQEAAVSRDDAVLAEVEQNINVAAQHLQLSGNIPAAILALQAADQRLARLEPRFLALRRAFARDLERLRGTAFVDVSGVNLRLENVITGIDRLPLALDNVPAPPQRADAEKTPEERAVWWRAFAQDAWKEIRGLVRIQRFDQQSPELISPDQSRILRENIKLRLLNARLALLSRDQWTFRNELAAAENWLKRYFNTDAKPVQSALTHLRQLLAIEIVIDLPTLHESLAAVQNAKANQEKP